jgi:hypothetical protein
MTSYKELLKQREALEQQISEARKRELSDAVSQVRALVAEFGLTAQDVFPSGRPSTATLPQVKPGLAGARLRSGFKTRAARNSLFNRLPSSAFKKPASAGFFIGA